MYFQARFKPVLSLTESTFAKRDFPLRKGLTGTIAHKVIEYHPFCIVMNFGAISFSPFIVYQIYYILCQTFLLGWRVHQSVNN